MTFRDWLVDYSGIIDYGGIIICAVALVVILSVLVAMFEFQRSQEVDELRVVIDDMRGVSDEYRQGWRDCIEYLRFIRMRSANVTSVSCCFHGGLNE